MTKPVRVSDEAHEIIVTMAGERTVKEGRVIRVSEILTDIIIEAGKRDEKRKIQEDDKKP